MGVRGVLAAARPAAAPAAARATCRIRRAGPSPATDCGTRSHRRRCSLPEHLPGACARLEGVVDIDDEALVATVAHEPSMVEDGLEVALGEAPGLGRECESFLERGCNPEAGELGRPAHLGPDPIGPRSRGKNQPALGTWAELEECCLLGADCFGLGVEGIARPLRIMGRIDPRVARSRESMAGNLPGTRGFPVDDHELVRGLPGVVSRWRATSRAPEGSPWTTTSSSPSTR